MQGRPGADGAQLEVTSQPAHVIVRQHKQHSEQEKLRVVAEKVPELVGNQFPAPLIERFEPLFYEPNAHHASNSRAGQV